jgi:predicted transcriptional regulator
MPIIDFREIPRADIANGNQDTFEMFAREFLEITGYRIVSGPDRGADQGRDLIAEEIRTGVGGETKIRWLVSCKHMAHSGRAIGVNDEVNVSDRVKAHGCQGFMGFYSSVASAGLSQRLEALQRETPGFEFNILYREIIERTLLDGQLDHIFERYFPDSFSAWNKRRVRLTLDLSPELVDLLQRLADATGETKSDVMRKSLVLMEFAVEAKRAGKRFGMAHHGQNLEVEIVGL